MLIFIILGFKSVSQSGAKHTTIVQKQTDTLVNTAQIFREEFGMEFGIIKHATYNEKRKYMEKSKYTAIK